jgi:hypothetical protein
MKRAYWFSEEADKIAKKLCAKQETWLTYSSNPIAEAWIRNSIAYYSAILEANDWQSALGYVGEQGELVKMAVPQARSLIRQIVTLVTKQRLAFTSIAEASGSDVMQAVKIASALTEELIQEQKLDKKSELITEQACIWGLSFLKVGWRTDKGTPYAASEQVVEDMAMPQAVYDGDVEISVPTVFDVYFDARIDDFDNVPWAVVRTIKNRWDMIAQFPELESEIMAIPRIIVRESGVRDHSTDLESDDMIYVYEAYHKPCPALPAGRMIMYSDDRTIYFDGQNRYGCIPLIPVRPEPIHKSGYGYPILSNLLPCQEMYDHSLSAIATNQSATAVQQILCPRGADISSQDVGGLNFVFFTPQNVDGGGKPEPMQLTQSAPETFKFAEVLKGYMLEISGINSAVRGAPPPGVTSGTAIATLTANSLEFMSSLQKSVDMALEGAITLALKTYMEFADVPRSILVTGKNNMAYGYEFTGKDLKAIKKVKINRSNPLMGTIAGRSDIAEKLLQTGLIKSPQQYFRIIEGAPTEELYRQELSETDLQVSENEALMRGEQVLVLATDDHPAHIQYHNMLLNNPEIRKNGQMVGAILQHIEEHNALAQTTDPALQAMVRTGKMPQMAPEQAMPTGGVMPEQGPAEKAAEPAPTAEDNLGRQL